MGPSDLPRILFPNKCRDVKFDVVHFIHSIYYLTVEDALVHCYEKELGEKGIIISITESEDNPWMRFASKFPDQRDLPRCKDAIAVVTRKGWKYFSCPGDSRTLISPTFLIARHVMEIIC